MKYLHTMVRVTDLEASLEFYCQRLGMVQVSRRDYKQGQFTLVMLAAAGDSQVAGTHDSPMLELTWNWDRQTYDQGRSFGHLAYRVEDIYQTCQELMDAGITINRPPRDGRMAFVRSPDNISIELLQDGPALLLVEPWLSMPNTGEW